MEKVRKFDPMQSEIDGAIVLAWMSLHMTKSEISRLSVSHGSTHFNTIVRDVDAAVLNSQLTAIGEMVGVEDNEEVHSEECAHDKGHD